MSSGKLCVRTRLNGREWLQLRSSQLRSSQMGEKVGLAGKWGFSDVELYCRGGLERFVPLSSSLAHQLLSRVKFFEMEKLSTVDCRRRRVRLAWSGGLSYVALACCFSLCNHRLPISWLIDWQIGISAGNNHYYWGALIRAPLPCQTRLDRAGMGTGGTGNWEWWYAPYAATVH